MCDYCDCRSLAPIGALSEDHEQLLERSSRVRDAIARGDSATANVELATLVQSLHAHTRTEERGLFSELRAEGSMVEHVAMLENDHRRLWAAVDALDPANAEWSSAALGVLDDLAAHVWIEEYDIFPAAVVGLSSDGWNRVIERTADAAVHEEV
jgi:hypothetical protein